MPNYDVEIVGARILTAEAAWEGCVAVRDGCIVALTKQPLGGAKRVIDAHGLVLMPGMIDQHVHFMDPGETEREDFICGTTAAAVAGVTTVIEHTHAHPVRSVREFREKKAYLADRSLIDFGLAAHLWPGYMHEVSGLWQEGVSFFKAFTCTTHGVPGLTSSQLQDAFSRLAEVDGRALVHCEDEHLTQDHAEVLRRQPLRDEGVLQAWRSKEAEELAVLQVGWLAKVTGARITLAHVSHPLVVTIAQWMRSQGADVWVETCPQYMFLHAEEIARRGPFGKFTPPARSAAEAAELKRLVAAGAVDILASDHAPATRAQKLAGDIWTCPFGLPGIDSTFPLLLTAAQQGDWSLQTLVRLYAQNPAKRLGLYPRKGSLQVGADADFILVDPTRSWTLTDDGVRSKAGWTPYAGWTCRGKTVMTWVRGQLVAEDGRVVAEPGTGQYVRRVTSLQTC
ncbi:MAG: dihydroorotase family protein [Alicyclobacillus sp.]|nr:dihydroorotase family protein [Alicyclobacillus sp.]